MFLVIPIRNNLKASNPKLPYTGNSCHVAQVNIFTRRTYPDISSNALTTGVIQP